MDAEARRVLLNERMADECRPFLMAALAEFGDVTSDQQAALARLISGAFWAGVKHGALEVEAVNVAPDDLDFDDLLSD